MTPLTQLPERAGVGFKAEHAQDVFDAVPTVGWFEIHPENYMVAGGPRLAMLEELSAHYPVSMHGVGLSLGGGEPLNNNHLADLKRLVDRFNPAMVSEHIAWSAHEGLYMADLLPTPMTKTSLSQLVDAINSVQDFIGRRILIENPTSYVPLPQNSIPELEFITEAAARSGCGLLIDVNNVYISAHNLGFDANTFIDAVPGDLVGEIHLAGHEEDANPDDNVLIDTHSRPVADPVWDLFDRLIARIGRKPTLIEWDNDVPSWDVLAREAALADRHLEYAVDAQFEAAS
ncbi:MULTISPECIES: DUF692 domain-containing protein [unclassified Thalassospira]|uniref:MNIO family bufferin maturase n=1 Tax=unclassified Thalassospira TaxID=2648997 RepID=UPI0007A59B6A|nr:MULTISPECIES: DUF692 domain-containing protein [unclassified Thalassospira]KZD01359.1 hypothetical protein AUQ41_19360 [Thalassospira sp. MCCC 1A02898]ONH88280.1 hypothetical protein TH47_11735 [Thalassospira sp. MCCC 1A02803]